MPLPVYRLRRLLAVTAIVLTVVVTSMIFYARSRTKNVLKTIPGKIGIDIKQTARGFQISKSDGKRTLFTVEASDVKQFKLNGNAELHNVSIILYGRDSSRYDQIYGDDFAFNQKTGDVTAQGDVQIDLVANPAGLASPDQSTPKEMKNPIHLRTRDLVFNKDTGNASTNSRVEFRTPQASGWAVGVQYAGKTNTLTLSSQIHIELTGPQAAVVDAQHGVITGDPREISLDHPHLDRQGGHLEADHASFYLDSDNHVQRVLASGNVTTATRMDRRKSSAASAIAETPTEMHGRADEAEFLFRGDQDVLSTATLRGNVHLEQSGTQPVEGDAGRVILDFANQNELQKIHAIDGARLTQKAVQSAAGASPAQYFELTAPVIDFIVAGKRVLQRASTSGAAQITIVQPATSAQPSPQRTVATAGKFDAAFSVTSGRSYLSSIHGAPNARMVNSAAGQPDRVSTSDSVDAIFLPQGGIDTVVQKGNFIYSDGQDPLKQMKAWGETARYTPANQSLVLTGNPRTQSAGMATTADIVRINRGSGEAVAEGNVKTSYSELKEQPNGALLASSSPIHVTSRTMTVHGNSGIALYEGNARLWQDANVIEAPSIQFDRDRRFVTAKGVPVHPVQTLLVQNEKAGTRTASSPKKSVPSTAISITAAKLTYSDSERKVHYEGGVLAKSTDFSASARTADAYLLPRSEFSTNSQVVGPGQLDRMVAQGDVTVQQPKRRAEGQTLVYTAAEDKFVLTGGPPSIFDAEHGKITGVSLTFFRRDDRVLVEGEARNPVVTQTRVAP